MATKLVVPGEQLIVNKWHVSPRMDLADLEYEVAFLGACLGVALCRRGAGRYVNEPVTFMILTEDDGAWFASGEGAIASFWLPDLVEQLTAAHRWLTDHAIKGQHGWIFK